MIRWATFDCYGTLIDWDGGVRAELARIWPQAPPARLLDTYHAVEPRVQADSSLPYREVLARSLEAIAAIEGLVLDDRESLVDSLPRWAPFPETRAALGELRRRGWRLAILSNTDPDLLATSLALIDVPVDLRITAAEAGSYKPAPGHFEAFRRATAAEPIRHVHVAASATHDLAPAAALGVPVVWINRGQETSDLPRRAELPDLRGLPGALEDIVSAA